MKTTDVHGRPVVSKHQATEEALKEAEVEKAEQDQEDYETLSDYDDWDRYDDDDNGFYGWWY